MEGSGRTTSQRYLVHGARMYYRWFSNIWSFQDVFPSVLRSGEGAPVTVSPGWHATSEKVQLQLNGPCGRQNLFDTQVSWLQWIHVDWVKKKKQNMANYKFEHLGVGLFALLWAVDLSDSLGLRSQNMFQHWRDSRFVAWCVRDVRKPPQHLDTETTTGRAEDIPFWITSKW